MRTLIIDGSCGAKSGKYTQAQVEILKGIEGSEIVSGYTHPAIVSELLKISEHIIVVSPVYWGRLPGMVEKMLDDSIEPGKHYKFVNMPFLTKRFGFKRSKGLTEIKEVHFVLNYGAPMLATFFQTIFRLKFMIFKLVLGVPLRKAHHIPTYLCEGDIGEGNRTKTIAKLKKLVDKCNLSAKPALMVTTR